MSLKSFWPQPSPSVFTPPSNSRKTAWTTQQPPERELQAYLKQRHPIDFSVLEQTPSGPRDFVQQALTRAALHGFTQPQECLRYLELMVVLGAGFNEDPQLPWVRWRLEDRPKEGSAIQPAVGAAPSPTSMTSPARQAGTIFERC